MNLHCTRELELDASRADGKQRRVPAVISTTFPVPRDGYREVLLHGADNVDLSRAPLPLIESHDGRRLNIGLVENLRLTGDKLRGDIVFGNSARANELWPDIEAGIVRHLSVGYTITDHRMRGDVAEITRWQPHETSLVSVPADPNAGTYRSFTMNERNEGQPAADAGEHLSRSERRSLAADITRSDAPLQAERQRAAEILEIGRQYAKYPGLERLAADSVRDGVSVDEFRARAMDALSSGPLRNADRSGSQVEAGSGRRYSLTRALAGMLDPRSVDNGYEREVSQELSRQLGRKPRGIFMPMGSLTQQRTLTVGGAPALVGVEHLSGAFIDALRARSVVMGLGPTILTGLVQDVSIPRLSTSASSQWIAGDGSDGLTDSAPGFDAVTLSPKTLGGWVKISRKMILQGAPDVESTILSDLAHIIATELDRAAIAGSGASNQPLGVVGTSGVATGTFAGASPTFAEIVAMEGALLTSNADASRGAYITTPALASLLKTTPKATNTGIFVWEAGADPGAGLMNGLSAFATSNAPSGKVILGNWADLIMGLWGGVDIEINPYEDFSKGIVSVRAFASVDFGVRHAQSFAVYSTP